jgi:hypothetical protein
MPNGTVQLRPMVRIVIDFDPNTQQINVHGPLNDGPMFLGLIEMAKVVFLETRQRTEQSRIAVVPAIFPTKQ